MSADTNENAAPGANQGRQSHDDGNAITNAPLGKTVGNGWIKMMRSEEALALLEHYPNAYLLLAQIAYRARWKDCPITGLKAGEALIGDWKKAGLRTPKVYQVAKERLEKAGLAVFKGGNKGTRAILLNSTIFGVLGDERGNQQDEPRGTQGETKGNPRGTNKKERIEDGKDGNNQLEIFQGLGDCMDGRKEESTPSPKQQAFEALKLRIGEFFGRRPTTKWSDDELKLLKSLGDIPEDDMEAVEKFYHAIIPKDDDKRRTSTLRLLENWTIEVDKARGWIAEQKHSTPKERAWADDKPDHREAKAQQEFSNIKHTIPIISR